MPRLTSFFLLASGADLKLLEQCPSEKSKYAGIGATIFFTGLFAAMAASYALFTVFDSYSISIVLGIVWGLMIFNLDRYIVSSIRKESRFQKEMAAALPRLVLAILISLVITKPLELKIFAKEIEPELVIMEQQIYAQQEAVVRARFEPTLKQFRQDIQNLKSEIVSKATQRDAMLYMAQQEADGTGGSKIKNAGPIYKLKKADADQAEKELRQLVQLSAGKIRTLENQQTDAEGRMNREVNRLTHSKRNGLAARTEALSRLTEQSVTVWWAHLFIIILFIVVESAPILVKLISRSGPYDALLRMAEHGYRCREIESIAQVNADIKRRTANLEQTEQKYVIRKLDAELI